MHGSISCLKRYIVCMPVFKSLGRLCNVVFIIGCIREHPILNEFLLLALLTSVPVLFHRAAVACNAIVLLIYPYYLLQQGTGSLLISYLSNSIVLLLPRFSTIL